MSRYISFLGYIGITSCSIPTICVDHFELWNTVTFTLGFQSFFSTTGIGLAAKYIQFYETAGEGLSFHTYRYSFLDGDEFSLAMMTTMSLVSSVVFALLTWYIDNVNPGLWRIRTFSIQFKLEYYPYDKYKSPHKKPPPARGGWYSGVNFGQLKSEVSHWTLVNSNLKFSISGGGGVILEWTLVNSNLKSSFWGGVILEWTLVNSNLKFSIFVGGVLWNQIREQGCSGEFGHKFYCLRLLYTNLLVHHR